MALTVSVVKRNVAGSMREAIADVTFDATYLTGGESFTTKLVDADETAAQAFVFVSGQSSAGWIFSYDYTNKTLQAFVASTGVEAASGANLSTATARILCRYASVV